MEKPDSIVESLGSCTLKPAGEFSEGTDDDQKKNREDVFAAACVLPQYHECHWSLINIFAVGPNIVLVSREYPTKVWIFDTQSSILRQAPSMPLELEYRNAGLVCDKLYVFGTQPFAEDVRTHWHVHAVTFDFTSQTWAAPFRSARVPLTCLTLTAATVDKNIYFISTHAKGSYYNHAEGSINPYTMPPVRLYEDTRSPVPTGVCVMDNVLYVYDTLRGLYWYDTENTLWKSVSDVPTLGMSAKSVAINEYYGELALIWTKEGDCGQVEVWCTIIALTKVEREIRGEAKESKLMGTVPPKYRLTHSVSVLG